MRYLSPITFVAVLAVAQVSQAQSFDSRFKFRFYDEDTWVRVVPTEVVLRKQPDGIVNYTLKGNQLATNGTAVIDVEDGNYDVEVKATGYQDMSSWFVMKGQPLRVNFSLIPEKKRPELTPAFLAQQHKAQCMTITGYITDAATGLPLGGVTVASGDKAATARTDTNGYYLLQLPLAANAAGAPARYFLKYTRAGYTTEQRHHFDAWNKGDLILRLRMQRGGGFHEEAMLKKRQPIQETLQP